MDGRLVAGKRLAGSEFKFTASGSAFEQLTRSFDGIAVAPGPYSLSGSVALKADSVSLDGIRLVRDRGSAVFDLEIGLPPGRRSAKFDLTAKGPDVRALLQHYQGFELAIADFSLKTRGNVNGARWSFQHFDLRIGDARVSANGTLDFRGNGQHGMFELSGNVPSLAAIGQFQGRQFRDQSLSWQAIVTSNIGVVDIGDLHGRLGDSEITGSARVSIAEIPEVTLDIQSDSLVLVSLLAEEMAPPDEGEGAEDTRLIPDFELPLQALRKLNGTVNLRIGDLQRDRLHIRDLVLRADLRDGRLDASKLAFNAPSGHLAARALIQPAGDSADVSLAVVARDFAVGLFGQNQDLEMTGDADIKVASTGGSLRQLAANANGVVFAEVRGGQVADMEFLHLFYGDMFSQILGTISPLLVSNTEAQLECAIFPYEISDGQLSSVPYTFFGTDSIRISSGTRVNLATEELDLDVRTSATKGLKLSAGQVLNPYIKVVGTLAEPRVAVDAQGTIISGGAAVATGGLTIVAKMGLERLFGSRDPCADVAKQARKALRDRFPDLPATTSAQ